MMVNRARGDVTLLVNGKNRRLSLTMGAMAEIEDELSMPIGGLGEIVKEGRMKPMMVLVYWLLKAGGWDDLTPENRVRLEFSIPDAAVAIKETFLAAGLGEDDEGDAGNAPAPKTGAARHRGVSGKK